MRSFAVAIGMMLWSGAALAQMKSNDAVLQSLTRCRSIAASDARLACFEQATSALENAVKAKDVTIVDKQDVREAKRSLFGFPIPRLPLFGGDRDDKTVKPEEITQVDTIIAGVRALNNGRFELRIAEPESVWNTTDPMTFGPKAGAKIRIRKGALGNYFLAVAGERTVRGIRVR